MKKNDRKSFIYILVISCVFWIIPILTGLNSIFSYILYALGGVTPSLVGIFLAYRNYDHNYLKDFFKRIFSFKLINLKSYIFIILFMPLSNILVMYVYYLVKGTHIDFSIFLSYIKDPAKLIILIFSTIIFGPIAEELGWRGYLLDNLEKKYNWLISSIIISIFWSIWHIPLFFINGTYQYNLLQESHIYFIDFMIGFLPASIIMGYLYYKNKKSILSAILFHFSINFSGELFNIQNDAKIYRTLILTIASIFIVLYYKIGNKRKM